METPRTSELTRLIREEVKAQMKRYAMARTRDDFINSLLGVLGPALSHHYRATLGTLNQRTDQVEKWQRQEEGFLEQFADRLIEPTKAKGLDRRQAVEQAVKELLQTDVLRRRKESNTFQKSYKLKKLIPLPENAHEEFLSHVWELVDSILSA
ncbi:MAG: hypothetical protein ACK4RK_15080 [Gemmataceae bacterium]